MGKSGDMDTNATMRERTIQALDNRVREFVTLHNVAQTAIESLDLNEILNSSLDRVVELLVVEVAAISFVDEQDGKTITVARGDVSPEFLNKIKKPSIRYSITDRVALFGVPVVIEDTSKYPQLIDISVSEEGLKSIAAIPLKSSGRVIGTLFVGNRNLHSFSSEDIQLLSAISEGLGPILKAAALYRALQDKVRQLEARNYELAVKRKDLIEKTRQTKRREKELDHERKFLQNIVAAIPDCLLILDKHLRLKSANLSFYELFQTNAKKTIGSKLADVLEDRDGKLSGRLAELFGTDDLVENYELRYQSEKLGERIFNITAIGVIVEEEEEQLLVVMQDITGRKLAEETLRRSEEKLRLMFDSLTEGVMVSDLKVNIEQVNEAVVQMHGYDSRAEFIGRSAFELITEGDHARVIEDMKRALEVGFAESLEYTFLKKDGSSFCVELSVAILKDATGNATGFIIVTKDITERRQMQEKLIVTDRLASIGELAAGIAHELNNPLTSVIGFSDMLMREDVPDKVREDLEVINREAKRTSDVVTNLLTFARRHEAERRSVNINAIIENVLQLRSYEQRVHNIEIKAHLAPDLPEILADPFRLQQVFINIVINAEYFMSKAHHRGMLNVTTERIDDTVRASFADDGPGIAPEKLGHLFDPFFTTKEVGKGTGLGLSICHGIITEHRGSIYAQSELGKGATFIIELPISR